MPEQPFSKSHVAADELPVMSYLPQIVLFSICALTLLVGLN